MFALRQFLRNNVPADGWIVLAMCTTIYGFGVYTASGKVKSEVVVTPHARGHLRNRMESKFGTLLTGANVADVR